MTAGMGFEGQHTPHLVLGEDVFGEFVGELGQREGGADALRSWAGMDVLLHGVVVPRDRTRVFMDEEPSRKDSAHG